MTRSKLAAIALLLAGGSAAFAQNRLQDSEYTSRFDLSAGYNVINANAPPGSCQCFTMNGAYVEGDYHAWKWLGVAGMATAGHAKDVSDLGQNLTLVTYMGGPRAQWNLSRLAFFGQFLAGAARGTGSYFPTSTGFKSSATTFAYSTGGGLDINLTPHWAVRAFNAQYLHTEFPNGSNDAQNQIQISTGVVYRFGGERNAPAPPMRVPPPPPRSEIQFTCGVDNASVAPGSAVQVVGQTMTLPDKLDVTYSWTASAGTIQGSGRLVTVDTTNLAPGVYHVDGRASLASDSSVTSSCQTTFSIRVDAASTPPTAVPSANDNSDFYKNMTDIFFDYDSEHLRPDAQRIASQDAAYLNSHPEINMTIAGYADERGSAEYNIALGLKRAITARTAFVEAGVSESRIKVLSYGKEKPFCTEDNDRCLQQNRRAQMLPDAP